LLTLVLVLVVMFLGGDPRPLLEQAQQQGPAANAPAGPPNPEEEQLADFVKVVLADTEDVWTELFAARGEVYRKPTLVLFSGRVESACGLASAAVGPFYCPADQKVYIDLSFYDDLHRKYDAPGDFAQAYVIAHEIGHHVQNQLGLTSKVHSLQQRVSKSEANELSVRLELQADFFAGVWGHYAAKRGLLEAGDLDEGLRAAAAIGDDRLQKQGQGYVVPDSFTHGSSEQRVRWFRKGLASGNMEEGDTFDTDDL
jgi:predicted metalloprotease